MVSFWQGDGGGGEQKKKKWEMLCCSCLVFLLNLSKAVGCMCPNKTGRGCLTTSALCREAAVLDKYLSPSNPRPSALPPGGYQHRKIGSQLNYSPAPLLVSHKHCCAHHLFELDSSANQNWDSIQKTQHLFSFRDTHFLTVPAQSQPQSSWNQPPPWHEGGLRVQSSKAKIRPPTLKRLYCP